MAGKALKSSGKQVIKYSRDGAVERNLAENSEKRISDRTEDAVLKVERTDEKLTSRGERPEQPPQEESHKRHKPHYEPEQQTVAENTQPSALQFEDKTFKFSETDTPAPIRNEPQPAVEPVGVPDNADTTVQQTEAPIAASTAPVIPRSDDTDEIPPDNSIIESLFADFYGSDDAPASGSKSEKFSFRQDEQPDTDKKRKSSRLQEDVTADSKLKTEAGNIALQQETAKSSLIFCPGAVKPTDSIEGEAADGEGKSKLSLKRRQRSDEPDDDETLSEESERADALKFEHSDRNFEKQSHFADKLSTGSASSKKLTDSKRVKEELSPEEAHLQEVRKQQRKAQQAEKAKADVDAKVSEAFDKTEKVLPMMSIEPLTDEEITSAVRRARLKAAHAEKAAGKAEVNLHKAESKLPTEQVFHRERKADSKSGKIKSKLRLEKEVKPQNRPDSFFQQGAKGVGATLTGAVKSRVHGKISEYEQDNAALKAAHKTEQVGESALKFTKDAIKRENAREKKAVYRKTERLQFERDSAVKKANRRSSLLQYEETKAKKKARDAARKAQRKRQRKKAQKAAKKTKTIIQKTAEVTQKVVSGIVHALSHPIVLIILLIIALIIVLIFCLVSLFGTVGAESGTTIIMSSYTSEDEQLYKSEDYMSGLEAELAARIQAIEEEYPDYDEYRYSIGQIGHSPYDLLSYLTAKYQTFEFENVKGDIDALFDALYSFSATGREEQRQRTVTYTDENGNVQTKTVTYTVKILEVSLTASEFDEVVRSLLTDEQYAQYELLKQTQGNRSDLF